MEKRENRLRNIIYISMVFSLVYIFGLVIKLDMDVVLQAFTVALCSLLIKFLIFNPVFIYSFIGLGFFAIILINYFFPNFTLLFLQGASSLLFNILNNLTRSELIASENIFLFWGILLIVFSFFTGIVIFKKKNKYFLLSVYMIFFLYYWYIYIDAAFWMMGFFLFLFFILLALDKYNQELLKKHELLISDFKGVFPSWIWTAVAYGTVIIILALVLPKPTSTVKWPGLRTKVYDTFPELENWRSYSSFSRGYGKASYFNFSSTGYEGDPSKLGGPIKLSDEKIMTVYADRPQYLRGNIKHKYNGDYWENQESSLGNYRSWNDFSNLSGSDKKSFYEEIDIKIQYNYFSSKTVFSPYRPSQIYFQDNSPIKVGNDYGVTNPNGIYKGESYRVIAQVPRPYNELIGLDMDYKKEDIIDLDKYLQVPEEKITEATKELTKDIVKGSNTDLEKAIAIEEHLRDNYEYSLDVDVVPEGHEFIDYFLFQEKKGYCTYYATTLAIMLRLEDIPSRYIEGYIARDLNEEGAYEVTQENGHAWVEAFIEPIGWLKLEATPTYFTGSRLSEILDEDIGEEMANDINSVLPDLDVIEEVEESPRDFPNDDIMSYEDGNTSSDSVKDIGEIEGRRKRYFSVFLSVLFSVLPLRFLLVFLKLKYKDFKVRKLSNRKRVIYLYDDIIRLIELAGYSQKNGETHREFADRISSRFHFFRGKNIEEITEIFIKIKYGRSSVSEDYILEMEKFKNNLKINIKNNLGTLDYLKLYLKL